MFFWGVFVTILTVRFQIPPITLCQFDLYDLMHVIGLMTNQLQRKCNNEDWGGGAFKNDTVMKCKS